MHRCHRRAMHHRSIRLHGRVVMGRWTCGSTPASHSALPMRCANSPTASIAAATWASAGADLSWLARTSDPAAGMRRLSTELVSFGKSVVCKAQACAELADLKRQRFRRSPAGCMPAIKSAHQVLAERTLEVERASTPWSASLNRCLSADDAREHCSMASAVGHAASACRPTASARPAQRRIRNAPGERSRARGQVLAPVQGVASCSDDRCACAPLSTAIALACNSLIVAKLQ